MAEVVRICASRGLRRSKTKKNEWLVAAALYRWCDHPGVGDDFSVNDETLPTEEPASCGAGLAQHAAVPRRMAVYLAELAETLDLHRTMLVLDDPNSQREDEVYRELAASYRDLAAGLRETTERMAAQRDLPMGAHDESLWTDEHLRAFARFVREQSALASALQVAAAHDEQMLASMQPPPD